MGVLERMRPDTPADWDRPSPGRPVLAERRPQESPKRAERAMPAFHDMLSRLATLERAPVFFSVQEATLRALARRLRRVKVAAGQMILYPARAGGSIFLLARGML